MKRGYRDHPDVDYFPRIPCVFLPILSQQFLSNSILFFLNSLKNDTAYVRSVYIRGTFAKQRCSHFLHQPRFVVVLVVNENKILLYIL